MSHLFRKCILVLLFVVLLLSSFTASVKADSETNQHIPNLNLNFDMTVPADIVNGYVSDFMEYFAEKLGHDIKLPDNGTIIGSDSEDLREIVSVPELREKSWEELRYGYKEAAVFNYVIDNRTVDYTINKYDIEIYERILWAMDHEVLDPEVVQNVHLGINFIIQSEYKIVHASMEDTRNQEKYNPTEEGQRRLQQAEAYWNNAMDHLAKGNTRPAMNAFQHANFSAQQVLALHGIEYTFEMMKKDSDGDKLPDIMENYCHTDSNKPDTDGDGLSDYYEVATTKTDPLLADTDEDSVRDGQEDYDKDQLNNLEEYHAGTNPKQADTDHDGLMDFEELNKYGTKPTKYDSDEDTVGDGREIELGLNPLVQESDVDGISDKDEQFSKPIPLKPNAMSPSTAIRMVPKLIIHSVSVESVAFHFGMRIIFGNSWITPIELSHLLKITPSIERDETR